MGNLHITSTMADLVRAEEQRFDEGKPKANYYVLENEQEGGMATLVLQYFKTSGTRGTSTKPLTEKTRQLVSRFMNQPAHIDDWYLFTAVHNPQEPRGFMSQFVSNMLRKALPDKTCKGAINFLRHSWGTAMGIDMDLPDEKAAALMDHSVKIHQQVYVDQFKRRMNGKAAAPPRTAPTDGAGPSNYVPPPARGRGRGRGRARG